MPDGQRRRPRGPSGPVSDIERFLMEVERLRKKSAQERVDDVDVVDEVEVVRPAPRPAPPPPPVAKRSARRIEEQVVEVVPVRKAVEATEFTAPPSAATAAPRRNTRSGRLVSPLIEQVTTMLTDRRQAQAAILLTEILGPPKCKKN